MTWLSSSAVDYIQCANMYVYLYRKIQRILTSLSVLVLATGCHCVDSRPCTRFLFSRHMSKDPGYAMMGSMDHVNNWQGQFHATPEEPFLERWSGSWL